MTYTIDAFLDKNKDTFYADLEVVLCTATNKLVNDLMTDPQYAHEQSAPSDGGSEPAKPSRRPAAATVSSKFKEQLASLIDKIGNANPHYVRCIKPNAAKVYLLPIPTKPDTSPTCCQGT